MKSKPLHENWSLYHPKKKIWIDASVPGCVHTDLIRANEILDPFWGRNEHEVQWIEECDWHYRCTFEWAGCRDWEKVDLVAKGLDTLAEIRLNDQVVGNSENMFTENRIGVSKTLRVGSNSLEIHFKSPMPYIRKRQKKHDGLEVNDSVGGSSTIRKEQCSFGWDWGPRLATCGIYKAIYLETRNSNRIESVRIRQKLDERGACLDLEPVLERKSKTAHFRSRVYFGEELIAEADGLDLVVEKPALWWPNGHGEQPLYRIEVDLILKGRVSDTWSRKIGLRTIELDRHTDDYGESFQFKVNGRAIFAKGANWIPAHSFVASVTREDYDTLLGSAAEAHMNMIRVWGGGIYESDDFYELCDEKGLLVWQDFMFACALYPANRPFLELVETEAIQQVRRLRHHACLALFCGNNELEMLGEFRRRMEAKPSYRKSYKQIFYELLKGIVETNSEIDYWPSSPHNPVGGPEAEPGNPAAGDAHFWNVWHSKKPVKDYEKTAFRFCSEFGMQSYPAPEITESFCPPDQLNIFSPIFENHQKNGGGNGTIFHYVSQRYRFPNSYRSLAYLSQINQAFCMKTGVEHWRRQMPRTMGALYWQLNDCWPVSSWSSLEFGGRWKALQYEAKRFFAPTLVSAHVPGEVVFDRFNLPRNSIDEIHLYAVSDAPAEITANLRWTLFEISGKKILDEHKRLRLRYGGSQKAKTLRASDWCKGHKPESLILRIRLETTEGNVLSENSVYLSLPRLMSFSEPSIRRTSKRKRSGGFEVTLESNSFQPHVQLELDGDPQARWSDNFIDLFPEEAVKITVEPTKPINASLFKQRLKLYTLSDSFN